MTASFLKSTYRAESFHIAVFSFPEPPLSVCDADLGKMVRVDPFFDQQTGRITVHEPATIAPSTTTSRGSTLGV